VYLAGPDVFLPDARVVADAKRALCERYGFVGVSPVDNSADISGLTKPEAARRISDANEASIRSCDLMVANITPFRGPSADVGTAYEMGFARALGKPVFAYTNIAGSLLERTRDLPDTGARAQPGGRLEDRFHMEIEDFDRADNLMLVGAVEASGVQVVVSPVDEAQRFTSLAGFETCLQLASQSRR